MTNYEKNEIIFYVFKCKSGLVNNCYVGHTSNFLRRRREHKSRCSNEKDKKHNFKVYKVIRENGGWDNWNMIEIYKQSCKDKRECERVEQQLIDEYNSDMNVRKSFLHIQPNETIGFIDDLNNVEPIGFNCCAVENDYINCLA